MEEEDGRIGQFEGARQLESYNNVAKGKRRTYFFDLKMTKEDETFVIVTESKRCKDRMGQNFYEKHRIYIYPDDLENFLLTLSQFSDSLKNRKSYYSLIKKTERSKVSDEVSAEQNQPDYNFSLNNEEENNDVDNL